MVTKRISWQETGEEEGGGGSARVDGQRGHGRARVEALPGGHPGACRPGCPAPKLWRRKRTFSRKGVDLQRAVKSKIG